MKLVKLVSSPVFVGLQYVVVFTVESEFRVIRMSRKGMQPFCSSSAVNLILGCLEFNQVRNYPGVLLI